MNTLFENTLSTLNSTYIIQETTRPTRPDRRDAEADGVGKPTRNGCPRSKRIEVPEEIVQIREQICLLFCLYFTPPLTPHHLHFAHKKVAQVAAVR